jgi:hypothetical protein
MLNTFQLELMIFNKKTNMKKITLLFILLSVSIFAQTDDNLKSKDKKELNYKIKSEDYSKLKDNELINKIESRDKKIKELEESLKKVNLANIQIANAGNNKYSKEVSELKKVIKETNDIFLREIFENKYINNKTYFKETDLAFEDNTKKFENSNKLINSIKVEEPDVEVLRVCDNAIKFNENYLKLFEIKKSVLSGKYNVAEVNEAIKKIENLPVLEPDSKLNITKNKIVGLLNNYLGNTCLLKKKLDALKNADQSPVIKQKYASLEKDDHFKDYPYLIQVLKNIKSNVNNYNSKEDLQPCIEINQNPIETPKTEKKDLK